MDCKFPLNGTNFVKCEWCEVLHRPCEKAAHLQICSRFWKSKCENHEMRSLVTRWCRFCGKRRWKIFFYSTLNFAIRKFLTVIFRIQLLDTSHEDNCVLRWKKKYDRLKKASLKRRTGIISGINSSRQKRRQKQDSELASLLKELGNCVPYQREDYDACLALFKRSKSSSSELSFLKKQLKLRKLQSDGELPNHLFTVSHQGRALSLTAIRDKFFALFNEE